MPYSLIHAKGNNMKNDEGIIEFKVAETVCVVGAYLFVILSFI